MKTWEEEIGTVEESMFGFDLFARTKTTTFIGKCSVIVTELYLKYVRRVMI